MAKVRIEEGHCPKCGSQDLEYGDSNLEYGDSEPKDQSIHYPYTCCNCDFDGEEVYSMEFAKHVSSDGLEVFPA